jgi:hypothetical protein
MCGILKNKETSNSSLKTTLNVYIYCKHNFYGSTRSKAEIRENLKGKTLSQ